MSDRKSLVSPPWLASSLVMLGLLLVAPIGTSGFVTISPRSDGFQSNFVLLSCQQTTHLSAATASDTVLVVDALPFEDEEQERPDVLAEPRVSFLNPCSFRKIPDRQLIAPRSVLSLYPLRC